jgi:Tfp pilus assembly protein PilF
MMSRKLNLVDHLLTTGRKLQEMGREQDARRIFGRLANLSELPAAIAEETQVRLAELNLKQHQFRRARRHLTAALAHRPNHARYHHLLASALDTDSRGDPGCAAEHYRRSLDLDPNQPRCLGEFGLLALRLGQPEEGLEALRRAVELTPDDPEVVGNLVEGLRQEGLLDEARVALRCAIFRNPRNPHFRKLKNDFEFQQLRQRQRLGQRLGADGQSTEDGPVLLPFVRPGPDSAPPAAGRKSVRRDGAAPPGAPHFPRHDRRPDRRYAQ